MKKIYKFKILILIILLVLGLLEITMNSKITLATVKNNNYNREAARDYAIKWAETSNPTYYNYINEGGDCTNFISQVLRAGGMEFLGGKNSATEVSSWFYYSQNIPNRSSTWTGANPFNQHFGKVHKRVHQYREYTVKDALNNFEEISKSIYEGDIVQYSRPNNIAFHSQAITDIIDIEKVNFSQHSNTINNFYKNGNLKYYLLGKPDNYNLIIYNIKEEKGDSISLSKEKMRNEKEKIDIDYKKELKEAIDMIKLSIDDTRFDNDSYGNDNTRIFLDELKSIVEEIETEMNYRNENSKELLDKLINNRSNI